MLLSQSPSSSFLQAPQPTQRFSLYPVSLSLSLTRSLARSASLCSFLAHFSFFLYLSLTLSSPCISPVPCAISLLQAAALLPGAEAQKAQPIRSLRGHTFGAARCHQLTPARMDSGCYRSHPWHQGSSPAAHEPTAMVRTVTTASLALQGRKRCSAQQEMPSESQKQASCDVRKYNCTAASDEKLTPQASISTSTAVKEASHSLAIATWS